VPAASPSAVELSVIITCYFEEHSIDEFHRRLSKTLEELGRSYEILFVNDGSTDGTWERLCAIFSADPNVSAVFDLFRNTGQANAATPGMMAARGDAFVLIDSDLQLDPEELPRLVEARDAGNDIVSGYRCQRQDPARRRFPSLLANVIMRRASNSTLRDFGCTFKIYDAKLVRAFELGPFKPWRPVPVIAAAGRIAEVPVSHHRRRYGESGWTFRKLFAYNMENIVNLSERFFQYLGGICLLLALGLALRIASSFVMDVSLLEVTPGLILNVVLAGILGLCAVLAGIGEFVIRNFIVLQRRPAFIVRRMRQREPRWANPRAAAGQQGGDSARS
jgi:glycosyltransferase involved in cell wall biosynthesis